MMYSQLDRYKTGKTISVPTKMYVGVSCVRTMDKDLPELEFKLGDILKHIAEIESRKGNWFFNRPKWDDAAILKRLYQELNSTTFKSHM